MAKYLEKPITKFNGNGSRCDWCVGFIVFSSLLQGFIDTYVQGAIENELSHIQIHHSSFKAEREAVIWMVHLILIG